MDVAADHRRGIEIKSNSKFLVGWNGKKLAREKVRWVSRQWTRTAAGLSGQAWDPCQPAGLNPQAAPGESHRLAAPGALGSSPSALAPPLNRSRSPGTNIQSASMYTLAGYDAHAI